MKPWWMTVALACGVLVHAPGTARVGWAPSDPAGGIPVAQEAAEGDGELTGPGDCWDTYVEEAIRAYLEYEACMAEQEWWDLLGQAGCATIYDMRALGAFSWWVTCVGFRS